MKILTKEKSREIITGLANKFGYQNFDYIDKYLNSSDIQVMRVNINRNGFPFLWYPQNQNMNYITNIWEDVLVIRDQTESEDWFEIFYCKLLPALTNALDKELKRIDLYGTGNLSSFTITMRRVIKFNTSEILEMLKLYASPETYFFPKDLSWILCITHEDLSFIAGTKEFIDKIRISFPEYKNYEPRYWREILGIDK